MGSGQEDQGLPDMAPGPSDRDASLIIILREEVGGVQSAAEKGLRRAKMSDLAVDSARRRPAIGLEAASLESHA
jgi:hypothetical protein